MESDDYIVLGHRRIAELLINGTVFPYLTGSDILKLGAKFGINSHEPYRTDDMINILEYLHREGKTEEFLDYLFHKLNINGMVMQIISDNASGNFKYDEVSMITEPSSINNKIVANVIRMDMLNSINIEISTANKKLVDTGNRVFITDDNNEVQIIDNDSQLINEDYLSHFIEQTRSDFNSGDLDNVITKSRSLLETVFKKVMDDHKVEYKSSGEIKYYRSLAYKCLNMNYDKSWNKEVADLINGITKIVDAVSNMRNIGGDAHGKSKIEYENNKINIKEAEAELVFNVSISVSRYYLKVNERSMKQN